MTKVSCGGKIIARGGGDYPRKTASVNGNPPQLHTDIKAGDLVYFRWKKHIGTGVAVSHIGIVAEDWSGSGKIITIEGNTISPSDGNGGYVAKDGRDYLIDSETEILGFSRPAYSY